MPSRGLYNPYHPLQEPEKSIESLLHLNLLMPIQWESMTALILALENLVVDQVHGFVDMKNHTRDDGSMWKPRMLGMLEDLYINNRMYYKLQIYFGMHSSSQYQSPPGFLCFSRYTSHWHPGTNWRPQHIAAGISISWHQVSMSWKFDLVPAVVLYDLFCFAIVMVVLYYSNI